MVTNIHPRHASRRMEREHDKIERRYKPSAREVFEERNGERVAHESQVRLLAGEVRLSPMQAQAVGFLRQGVGVSEGSESRYVRQLADKGVAHVVNGTWQLTEVGQAVQL